MNTKANLRRGPWIQLNERLAARSGMLLLLLTLPAAVQAQFTYTTNNGNVTITGYTGSDGDVIIPDTIDGLPVTSIGQIAFLQCTRLTSVTIPDSVTSIGYSAFESCTSLTSVTIGNGVTSIRYRVFAGCTSLTSVTIPNSVTDIEGLAFIACGSLTNVTIPDNVTTIGGSAFQSCASLTNVTIGNSLTNIGDWAFADCASLTGPDFHGNAPSVGGSSVFSGDSQATVYYFPGTSGWGTTFGGRPTVLWNSPAIQTPPQTQTAGKVPVNEIVMFPSDAVRLGERADSFWLVGPKRGRPSVMRSS